MVRIPFKGTTWQPGIEDTDGEDRSAVLQGSSKALPCRGRWDFAADGPARLDARRPPARVVPAGRLPDVLRLSRCRAGSSPPRTSYLRLGRSRHALPEACEEDAWTGVRWRIRAKTFAHVMVAQPGYESAYRDITGDAAGATVADLPRHR